MMMNSQSNQQYQQLRIEHLKEGRDHASGLCMHSKPRRREGKQIVKGDNLKVWMGYLQ